MQTAFERFIAPARRKPQLWRLGLGVGLCVVCSILGVVAVFGLGWIILADGAPLLDWANSTASAERSHGTLLLLFTFLGLGFGPVVAVRVLHKRPVRSLFGPNGARILRDFVIAAGVVGGLMTLSLAIWSISYDALPNLSLSVWLGLLPLTILGLLIQTGAEELVFRGYLQQQLAARFRATAIWLVVPSLLFGFVHYNPALPTESALGIVGAATAFGLAAADLTARTGNIGAAWGFHFANNFAAIAILSTEGSITGLALFLTPYDLGDQATLDPLVALDLGFLLLAWWLVRRAVAR